MQSAAFYGFHLGCEYYAASSSDDVISCSYYSAGVPTTSIAEVGE